MIPRTTIPPGTIPRGTTPPGANPPMTGAACILPDCEPRRLGSDLFHALSQPLTALCCSLELALQQPLTAEQYRENAGRALMQAERASWLATGMRELFDAGQVGEDCEVLPLQAAVENAIDDVALVAEAAGVRIRCVTGSACPVWFEAQRLRSGLFHLLGSMVGCGGRGSEVRIELAESGKQSLLALTVSGAGSVHDQALLISTEDDSHRKLAQRLGLGIARAIFEAAGGSFRAERTVDWMSIEIRIPPV
jgi:K+-sensing histidine kinase KdpD